MQDPRPSGAQSTAPILAPGAGLPAFADFFELSLDLMCVAGFDGYFKVVNRAFTETLGTSREELLRRPFFELIHPDDVESTAAAIALIADGDRVCDFENRYRHENGTFVWLQWRAQIAEDGTIHAVARDVTESKRRMVLLEEVSRVASVGGWELDFVTGDLHWTDETYRLHELDPEFFTPTLETAIDFYHPNSVEVISRAVAHGKETGEGYDLELQLITRTGKTIDVRSVGSFVYEEGVVVRAYGSFQDITERKRAERDYRELNALMMAAIEQSPAGILVADAPSGKIRIANSAALGIRGGDRAVLTDIPVELHPETWRSLHADGSPFRPEDLPLSRAVQCGETVRDCDVIIRRQDGEERWVLGNAAPVRNDVGDVIAGIVVFPDITDRKRSEEALRRQRMILGATTDFVASCDPEQRLIYYNRSFRELLGFLEEADSRTHCVAECHAPREYERLCTEGIPYAIEHGAWVGETELLAADGRALPVSQVILCHRNDRGEVEFLSTIMRDLTESKALEDKLRQAQKMEGIGRLAGGVAHDFNNLLTVIMGNLELLDLEVEEGTGAHGRIADIEQASRQAAALTNQLLAFARKQVIEPLVVEVNDLVTETVSMLRRIVGEDVELATRLSPEPWNVRVDPGQLVQVLLNLAVNARDAMPRGGELQIGTENLVLGSSQVPAGSDLTAGEYVRVRVSDSGDGMDEEARQNAFEPFFTTKEKGRGTGLGLATCHGIVLQAGGHISVESGSEGSTFTILLPRAHELPDVQAAGVDEHLGGTETVLIVEDEDPVREIARLALARLGYHVLTAATSEEALELLERVGDTVDVIVSDVVLPGLSGPELIRRIQPRHPRARVLFASGYAGDQVSAHGLQEGGAHFIQKPYAPSQLAAEVRQLLAPR